MKFRKETDVLPQIMIIPMIDIMFFLLIFFMFSSVNMSNINTIPLKLAAMQDTRPTAIKGIAISIDKKGCVFVGTEATTKENMVKYVVRARQETKDILIVLRIDKEASYSYIAEVMNELKKAGITRLALQAETEP